MALSLTYKGFNYVDFYNGIYDTTNLNTTMPEVAATGASSVALTPDFGVDVATNSVYAGNSTTDTVADLTAAVEKATAEGMTSLVRPLIDFLYPQVSPHNGVPNYYVPDDFTSIFDPNGTGATTTAYSPPGKTTYAGDTPAGTTPSSIPKGTSDGDFVNYRGELETTDEGGGDLNAATFFGSPTTAGSYDDMIVTEAKAAAAAGATLFSVGTELDSLADDPNDKSYWDILIADVRAAAPSLKLTYSANWANAGDVQFWNKLDYVGLDGYVPLSNTIPNAANSNNPSLASLEAGWNTVSNVVVAYSDGQTVSQILDGEGLGDVSAIGAFDTLAQQSMSKQFIFTELGYQNDTGAANDPTGGSATGVADASLQAELFSAFFDAWGQAQATAVGNGGKVDGIPFSLIGAYFWDYVPDGSNDGWSPELNPAAASVINSNFSTVSPVVVIAETNQAGLAGFEGSPTAARGTAGTSGTGALAGDSDTNGAALSISAVGGGSVGSFFSTKYGSLELNANGSYTYFAEPSTALADAPAGAPAADAITFTVTDTNGATSTSTLTIYDYRNPIVVAESASTTAGATVNRTAGTAGTGALAGDSGLDGASLSVAAINNLGEPLSNPIAGQYGTLTLNANGSYSYTADSRGLLESAFSANGEKPLVDGFTLDVSGGLGTYAVTNLSVSVAPPATPGDLNGDGLADMIFETSNNQFLASLSTSTSTTPSFTTPQQWAAEGGPALTGEAQYADVNGDGKTDLIYQGTNNQFWVSLSSGTGFAPGQLAATEGGPFEAGEAQYADVTGNGEADLIYQGTNNQFWVSLSNGAGTFGPGILAATEGGPFEVSEAQYADVIGNGLDDLIYQGQDNKFWVSLSNGAGTFGPGILAATEGGPFEAGEAQYADVTGNGEADLIYQGTNNQFWVSLSNGAGTFGPGILAATEGGPFEAGEAQYADLTGDGMDDLIYQGQDNRFWVSLSNGNGTFGPGQLWGQEGGPFMPGEAQFADVNGDSKADLIYQGADNKIWVSLSTGTSFAPGQLEANFGGTFQAGMFHV